MKTILGGLALALAGGAAAQEVQEAQGYPRARGHLEIRQRFEAVDNPNFGAVPDTPGGYLMQRYMVGGEIEASPEVRLVGQLKSALVHGRRGGPRPTDLNRLDLHQAYLEADLSETTRLRLGRQEMSFGSDRLISRREGPNSRLAFDAVRVGLKLDEAQFDLLAARPVSSDSGYFDDHPDPGRALWGAYATLPCEWLPGQGKLDAYYLGYHNQQVRFQEGLGDETRHSIGVRAFGKSGRWDYNLEGVYQFGEFGAGRIAAWTVASDLGYTFSAWPTTPRLSVRTDLASGDSRAGDGRLGTFNALFPKGSYFGEIALIGPANLIDVHPAVQIQLAANLEFSSDVDFFWRQSSADGLYGPSLNLLRPDNGSTSRHIGSQWSQNLTWKIDPHTTVVLNYAHFWPGAFLRDTGPAAPVDFFAGWVNFKI